PDVSGTSGSRARAHFGLAAGSMRIGTGGEYAGASAGSIGTGVVGEGVVARSKIDAPPNASRRATYGQGSGALSGRPNAFRTNGVSPSSIARYGCRPRRSISPGSRRAVPRS